MVVMFVCFIVYHESTAVTEKCGGLHNGMNLSETVPAVCIERGLTVTAGGNEVSDVRAVEVLRTQEDIHFALSLPALTAADKVCYVCNIVVLTAVQVRTVACAF
jgi:hypothetical protein